MKVMLNQVKHLMPDDKLLARHGAAGIFALGAQRDNLCFG
jgi:hypothetical protein